MKKKKEVSMLICPNPKCNRRHLRKYETKDGGYYYECGACGYKTPVHYPTNPDEVIIRRDPNEDQIIK